MSLFFTLKQTIKQALSSNRQKSMEVTKDASVRVNEDGESLFSLLTCDWVRPLLDKGRSGVSLSSKDLFPLPESLNVRKVHQRFSEILKGTTIQPGGQKKVSLLKALHNAYGKEFYLLCGILELMDKLMFLTHPMLLWVLISFLENANHSSYVGYCYVIVYVFWSFVIVGVDSLYEYTTKHVYFKVRIAITTTIYQKILSVSSVSLSQFSTGEIINFLGTDTDRMVAFCHMFHMVWIIPIKIMVCLCVLYQLVGITFLGGLMVALTLAPIIRIVITKQTALNKLLIKQKDKRIELMNEVFGGIKIIKFYTWEDHFRSMIDKVREAELQTMKQHKVLGAIIVCLSTVTPILMTLLTFSAYVMLGNIVTASKIFTSLAVFVKLNGCLNDLPRVFSSIMEAIISLERIEQLISLQDVHPLGYHGENSQESNRSDNVISVTAGRFTWERKKGKLHKTPGESGDVISSQSGTLTLRKPSQSGTLTLRNTSQSGAFTLRNISISIKKGQLIGVVGKVGAGKSSFLHALLTEMVREEGTMFVADPKQGFALVSQEPWLQQTTIRDNILFGSAFNGKKYTEILSAVSLRRDIQILPAGDRTDVGENGVTLSGGQRARLALARALYQDKNVYLLDDPLAAVDAHVAQRIYDKCIMGLLRNKTRILCTHHPKFLGRADLVVVLNDGVITKMGVPSDVLSDITFVEHTSQLSDSSGYESGYTHNNDRDRSLGMEDQFSRKISSPVYRTLLAALGTWLPLAMLISVLFMEASARIKDWLLTKWVSGLTDYNIDVSRYLCFHDNMSSPNSYTQVYGLNDIDASVNVTEHDTSALYYLSVYACLAAVYSLFSLVKEVMFVYGGISLARVIHNNFLNTLLKAPMSFFDVTPIGRILNILSSDIGTIDDSLGQMINMVLCHFVEVVGTLFLAGYGMPWFLALLLPLSAAYYHIQERYRHTSREVRRIESLKRSPIFSQLSETVSGVVTIRAFRETDRFKDKHFDCLNEWLEARYTTHNIGNWLWIQTEAVVNAMMTGIAFLAVLQHSLNGIDPSVVGLATTYVLSLAYILDPFVCYLAETQKQMMSVERIQEFIDVIPRERWPGIQPSFSWPATGVICYSNVYLKYRDGLPDVLKDISFSIRHGEKVGIVGRTGSGKSSLFHALFRTVEIDSGNITIDGVNTKQLDLKEVRRHLAVIPQDPFLFRGTVRENLDPTSRYSDQELWRVLGKCHLRQSVDRLGGLTGRVCGKGRRFSRGQTQLVCLARALLTKSKVLCIDEATASVDLETDVLIQETIRQEFVDSTVLTIAHRINTIMDSDRVLVMNKGQKVELDTPENLLKNTHSAFYQLVHGGTCNSSG